MESSSQKPLQGVRVLDLTENETSATQALAWYGAEVVKIENPGGGDPARRVGTGEGRDSPYFILLNCNKRSVTLDLRTEQGKRMLRAMVAKADVFIENLAPGVVDELGFSYEEANAINPRIIYTQIKGFGSDGPFAHNPCSDTIAQALSGCMAVTGYKNGAPLRAGPTLGETGAGLLSVSGIMAALWQRYETGRGQRIEVAMQDAIVNYARIAYFAAFYLNEFGRPARRSGNEGLIYDHAPANGYHCKPFGPNDYVVIYSSRNVQANKEHWERLLQIMGRDDLMDDPRFGSVDARMANVDFIDELIGGWVRQHTKHEVMQILGKAKVPVGMVLDTSDLRGDPYLRERGMFVTVQHPDRGPIVVPGWPVVMSDATVEVEASPLLGQHNAEVYGGWLGLDATQLGKLHAEGII